MSLFSRFCSSSHLNLHHPWAASSCSRSLAFLLVLHRSIKYHTGLQEMLVCADSAEKSAGFLESAQQTEQICFAAARPWAETSAEGWLKTTGPSAHTGRICLLRPLWFLHQTVRNGSGFPSFRRLIWTLINVKCMHSRSFQHLKAHPAQIRVMISTSWSLCRTRILCQAVSPAVCGNRHRGLQSHSFGLALNN